MREEEEGHQAGSWRAGDRGGGGGGGGGFYLVGAGDVEVPGYDDAMHEPVPGQLRVVGQVHGGGPPVHVEGSQVVVLYLTQREAHLGLKDTVIVHFKNMRDLGHGGSRDRAR